MNADADWEVEGTCSHTRDNVLGETTVIVSHTTENRKGVWTEDLITWGPGARGHCRVRVLWWAGG